uniref:Density-regulated protein n=1 Tax=Salvator merianae TaxID=96440 RepID=A0A8D0E958_SALMN
MPRFFLQLRRRTGWAGALARSACALAAFRAPPPSRPPPPSSSPEHQEWLCPAAVHVPVQTRSGATTAGRAASSASSSPRTAPGGPPGLVRWQWKQLNLQSLIVKETNDATPGQMLTTLCEFSTAEYCEYMPDVTKCRQWLEKNFPNEFAKLTVENSPKQESGVGEGQGTTGEEEEKKKQKRGGRGQIKQKKKTVPQKVTIAKIPRAKKKYVTRVCGLGTFEIDLKEAQRFFAQKFSCGASVTGEDEIIIQGDFTDDIIEVIQEKWPEVDDDSIEDLGEVKK